MFLHVSVILSAGWACVATLGMHSRGRAWQGGMHGGRCAWQGGHVWQGACVHMVNERAVRILLECILVVHMFCLLFCFKNFWRTEVIFIGSLIPCFEPLGDVSSGFVLGRGVGVTHSHRLWCYTCWPLGSQYGSQAILFHIPASRHWWDSKLGSIVLSLPHRVRPGRHSTWLFP